MCIALAAKTARPSIKKAIVLDKKRKVAGARIKLNVRAEKPLSEDDQPALNLLNCKKRLNCIVTKSSFLSHKNTFGRYSSSV